MDIVFLGNHSVDYSSESHHAATLEAMGHTVYRIQEGKESLDGLRAMDLFIWVHTHGVKVPGIEKHLAYLRKMGTPAITYHLDLWLGLRRQSEMVGPYWDLDHFFTADPQMATWINERETPHSHLHKMQGHYLPAAVFGPECIVGEYLDPHPYANNVIFVGQRNYHPEWPYRRQLVDWLADTYGTRFTRIAGDCPSGTVRGGALNHLYQTSKVVVGDSLCPGFTYRGYWSDRVYETLGRGGFLIHPRVPGMDEVFDDGEHLVFYEYGDFYALQKAIDHCLIADQGREAIRQQGQRYVAAKHTYRQRWQTILDTVV